MVHSRDCNRTSIGVKRGIIVHVWTEPRFKGILRRYANKRTYLSDSDSATRKRKADRTNLSICRSMPIFHICHGRWQGSWALVCDISYRAVMDVPQRLDKGEHLLNYCIFTKRRYRWISSQGSSPKCLWNLQPRGQDLWLCYGRALADCNGRPVDFCTSILVSFPCWTLNRLVCSRLQ